MIGKLKQNLLLACLVISSVTVFYLGQHAMECHHRIEERSQPAKVEHVHPTPRTPPTIKANRTMPYDKDMPLIFIGGVPRSGTTLMRAMLDAHRDIRCGEETRVIPRILAVKQMWARSSKEKLRLDEAGVTDEVLDSAMQAFILEIIVKHGDPAPYLCNKDPFALKSLSYLAKIFPNAKFLLMVRDGRASVHSMISRKVTIAGFDLSSYRDCMSKWNRAIETMYSQCMEVGYKRCMLVHYEQLVLHPEQWMQTLLKFLGIPWDDAVLHHEEMIGKAGGVSLSKVERSTDQVIKPVNVEALSKWVGKIPPDVLRDMPIIAPMLAKLGYDPYANPPNYGKPDQKVLENTKRVSKGEFQLPDFLRDAQQVREALSKQQKDTDPSIQVGDWVSIREHRRRNYLSARWISPKQVLLTTTTAVRVQGDLNWHHKRHCKRVAKPATPSGDVQFTKETATPKECTRGSESEQRDISAQPILVPSTHRTQGDIHTTPNSVTETPLTTKSGCRTRRNRSPSHSSLGLEALFAIPAELCGDPARQREDSERAHRRSQRKGFFNVR